jgi:hypothetical protein
LEIQQKQNLSAGQFCSFHPCQKFLILMQIKDTLISATRPSIHDAVSLALFRWHWQLASGV